MATAFPLDLYLSRIQLHRADLLPSLELLQQLQLQHLRHIPFENIDVVVGKRISMQAQDVQAKLLCLQGAGGRGGYCFEHNSLLNHALVALG
jgi:N-hydroxyarylamine O-acetyltransferase